MLSKCQHCDRSFEEANQKSRHENYFCPLGPCSVKCDKCGKYYKSHRIASHPCTKDVLKFMDVGLKDFKAFVESDKAYNLKMRKALADRNQSFISFHRQRAQAAELDFRVELNRRAHQYCQGPTGDNPCLYQVKIEQETTFVLVDSKKPKTAKGYIIVYMNVRCFLCHTNDSGRKLRQRQLKQDRNNDMELTLSMPEFRGRCEAFGNCKIACSLGERFCVEHRRYLADRVRINTLRLLEAGGHASLLTEADRISTLNKCIGSLSSRSLPGEFRRFEALFKAQAANVVFLDTEFAGELLLQIGVVDIRGNVLSNAVIDYSCSREDLLTKERRLRAHNIKRRSGVSSGDNPSLRVCALKKFYGEDGIMPCFAQQSIAPDQLASHLESIGVTAQSIVFEWSNSDRDLRAVRGVVEQYTQGPANLPRAPIKPLYWFKALGFMPTLQLELLYPYVLPYCDLLNRRAHLADTDALKLRKLAIWFVASHRGCRGLMELIA